MSRRRFFKSCARKRLYSDWIKQAFAVLIVGAICAGIVQFGLYSMELVRYITADYDFAFLVYGVYSALSLAIVIPLLYGLLYFEINAVEHNKSELSDLFYAFYSTETIARAYSLFCSFVLRAFLCFVPVLAVIVCRAVLNLYFPEIAEYLVRNVSVSKLGWKILLTVFLFVGFVLSSKHLFGVYICIRFENVKIRDGFYAAGMCMYGSRREMAGLFISFFPLFVVSLYSFGLLLIMYFLPYLLIAFTVYSKYIYEKEMYTRNTHNILYSMENFEI